jgi:uncharacterized protein
MEHLQFGLTQQQIQAITQCFRKYSSIQQVIIYGSRAKGNFKNGSDIDLTIVGDLCFNDLLALEVELDDLLLPQKIDLSLYSQISNLALLEHIQRVGKIFFAQNP